ncbi:MAG: hypothetical protein WCZ47_03590 [Bacilli bacterium]
MSNRHGLLITSLYVFAFLCLYCLKRLLIKKDEKRYRVFIIIFEWINVFLPMAFLFTLNGKWLFSDEYLPSQLPQDLIFSTFHFLMIGVSLLLTIIYLKKARQEQTKTKTYFWGKLNQVDYEVFKFGVLLISIELYKQLVYLNLRNGLDNYAWFGFPLQFCSLPLYLFLITPFIKNKKIQDSLYYYLALYSLAAGLSVTLTGMGVFTLDVSISLHTMIWHGSMIVVGLYIGASKKFGQNYRQYISATIVLLATIVFIQIVNTTFHYLSFKNPNLEAFDGFYISPWGVSSNIPYLSSLRNILHEANVPIFVTGFLISLLYFLVAALMGFLIFLLYQHNYKRLENKKFKEETLLSSEDN